MKDYVHKSKAIVKQVLETPKRERPGRHVVAALFVVLMLAPGPGTADPLLRQNWIPEERERLRGILYRMAQSVERVEGRLDVADEQGRRFQMDYGGGLSFPGIEKEWKPRVPDTRETPFHLTEADSLYAMGSREEAVLVWKGLVGMQLYLQDQSPAHVRQSAAAASRKLDRLRAQPGFQGVDRATDPFAFAVADDETVLWSDLFSVRVVMRGKFRFRPASSIPSDRDVERSTAILGGKDVALTVGMENRLRGLPVPVEDYVDIMDRRRGAGEQRRSDIGLKRKRLAHPALRSGSLLFESSTSIPPAVFYEYYSVHSGGGLWIEARGPEAKSTLEAILAHPRFRPGGAR